MVKWSKVEEVFVFLLKVTSLLFHQPPHLLQVPSAGSIMQWSPAHAASLQRQERQARSNMKAPPHHSQHSEHSSTPAHHPITTAPLARTSAVFQLLQLKHSCIIN